ncbi:hypothetical protein OIO90_001593 [Microbotryomycetes sp. JL221]|nr:hypothetical protein OIO90_001593 [Microbotryomycetes sp. JL221]
MSNSDGVNVPLSQGAGYGVVIGLGALFAIGMVAITHLMFRRGTKDNNEEFTVAKRSLGTGLTAAGVISSWTWSTTLLSSCTVAYTYGVAGAFYYAVCNSTQIMVFSNLAIESKRKAPNAHTFLEIIRLVVSSILLGGAAAINSLTGMSVYASAWLLPASVAVYTLKGGLRATILTDYVHTAIILIIIFIFWFAAYATSDQIGSPGQMWDLLVAAQRRNQDAPTKENSYLTIRALGALKFAILSLLEYTGVVWLDNSFHQKGIASDPASTVPGYIAGGLSWFSMPFTLATTAGLVAVALENTDRFPTFPRRMTSSEVSAGLVLPYAAEALLGKGGAGAVLVSMFMSCTSALSAVLIGVSTVISFDIYKTYFRKQADDRALLKAGHWSVVGFSIWMAAFASLLFGIGIDLGFIYNMTGIFTGPAIPPLVLTFFSSRQSAVGASAGIWVGFIAAVISWLTLAYRFSGEVTIASVGLLDPCLYGCVTGIGASAIVTGVITLAFPVHYDWASLRAVRIIDEDGKEVDVAANDTTGYDPERLRKAAYLARGVALFLFLALFIVWPFSLYGTGYIFSRSFFTGWVIVSLLWAIFAFACVVILPIVEGRHTLASLFVSLFRKGSTVFSSNSSTNQSNKEKTPSSTVAVSPSSASLEEKA